jgi:hypothetical protein
MTGRSFANASAAAPPAVYFAKLLPVIRSLPTRTTIVGEDFANASAAAPPAVYFAKSSPGHSAFTEQNEYAGTSCLSQCHQDQALILVSFLSPVNSAGVKLCGND